MLLLPASVTTSFTLRARMAPPRPQDFKAGFTGLLVAVVFLAVVIYGMVMFTNWFIASKGEAHAEQTTH
jgi:hypothetical protein